MKAKISLVLLGLVLLTMVGCTTSQRVIFLETPPEESMANLAIDLAHYEEKYGEYDAVFLFIEEIIENSGSREKGFLDTGRWSYTMIDRQKYIVFNPDLEDLTTFQTYGMPDNLYVRVTTPDNKTRHYNSTDLRAGLDSDGDRVYTIVLQDIVRGTIVETGRDWSYNKTYPHSLEHVFEMRYRWPCERSSFTYAYPDWWRLDFKETNLDNTIPIEVSHDVAGKKKIVTCEMLNIEAVEDEPYSPYFREIAQYIQFHVTELEMLSMRYKTAGSWSKFGKNVQDNILDKAGRNSDVVAQATRDVVGDASTETEKVARILTFVQATIEPGKGRNGDFAKILKEKSGNGIDLTSLTGAMLNQAGLPARFMLVHPANEGRFDPQYVNESQVRYPALRVPVDGEMRVLLPFMENLPQNFIPRFLQGQDALVFNNTGFETRRMTTDPSELDDFFLWTLPDGDPLDDTSGHVYDLEIRPDGDIGAVEKITVHGFFAYQARQSLKDLLDDEQKKVVKGMIAIEDAEVDLETFEIENLTNYEEPLVITAHYVIRNMVTVTPEEAVFHTGGLFSPLTGVKIAVDTTKRQNNIRIYSDEHHMKEISITMPPQWSLVTELPTVSVQNIFGQLEGEAGLEDGRITVQQELRLNGIDAAPDMNPEFMQLIIGNNTFSVPALIFSVGSEE